MANGDVHNVEGTFFLTGATEEQLNQLKSHCENDCDCKCEVSPEGVAVITGPADGFESAHAGVNLLQAEIKRTQDENGPTATPPGVLERWERQAKAYGENRAAQSVEGRTPQVEAVQTETGESHFRTVAGAEQPKAYGSVGQAGGMGAGMAEFDPNVSQEQLAQTLLTTANPNQEAPHQNIARMKEAGIQPTSDSPGEQLDNGQTEQTSGSVLQNQQ